MIIDESWSSASYDFTPANLRSAHPHWSSVVYEFNLESIKLGLEPKRLTHAITAARAHSGDWISVTPIAQIGTKLNDDELDILVALRLGLIISHPHRCRCSSTIRPDGLHPLSCQHCAGRFPRHAAINDIIKLALDTTGFHSVMKPVGLDRGDGRRSDGIIVFRY